MFSKRLRIFVMLLAIVPFVVNCGGGGGGTSTPGNTKPVADAGPNQTPAPGSLVALDGSGSSDADNDPLTYAWSFTVKPAGSTVVLSDSTVIAPTFTPDLGGSYTLQLVVNDGTEDSLPASVTILSQASGALDTGFAAPDGFAVIDTAAGDDDFGFGTALDASGNVYVTGYSVNTNGDADMALWKYKSDGTLDTTFAVGGVAIYDRGATPASGLADDIGNAVVVDAAGLIYVTGSSVNNAGNEDTALWKYKADGTLDTTFAVGGVVFHDGAAGGTGRDFGRALVLNSSRVYVAGSSTTVAGDSDMTIWCYLTSDGSLDTSFSGDGIAVHGNAAGGNSFDAGLGIALDAAGRPNVSGYSYSLLGGSEMVIWRYTTAGLLDVGFGGGNGYVVHGDAAGGNGDDFGNTIAVNTAGTIYVAGESLNAGFLKDMVVWSYSSTGSLDPAFGGSGVVVFTDASGGVTDDVGEGILLDPAGQILVAGYGANSFGDNDMVVWRYTSSGQLDANFATNGFISHDNAAGGMADDLGKALALGTSGHLYVAGNSLNGAGDDDMVLWRYK